MQGIRNLKIATAGPERERPLLSWGNRQRIAFLGAIVLVAGTGWSAWVFETRPRALLDVHRFSPVVAWNLWLDLSRGPDAPQNPRERAYYQAVSANNRWLTIGIVVAGVGLVMIGGAFCIPKRPAGQAGPGASNQRRRA